VGHIDDFEQGTTADWQHGRENEHEPRLSDGGPAGAGDDFLQFSSSGESFAGSKLVMFNRGDNWTGDYLAAGVTALEVEMNNFGPTDVTMRFMFEGNGPQVFTDGIALPAGSGWQHASFSLNPADLFSNGDITATLSSVTALWFLHNVEPSHPGLPELASFGIDNLEAIGVVVNPTLFGDYNGNQAVEQADLDLVLLNWGAAAEPPPAAWIHDLPLGNIDQEELDGVLLHWGNMAQQLNAASVPEPGALSLLAACAVLAACSGGRALKAL
jgi:hypothetical protein